MFARNIVVVGTGYVGLTTGACLASLGHRVVCADIDAAEVEMLSAGNVRIAEPGLVELVREGMAALLRQAGALLVGHDPGLTAGGPLPVDPALMSVVDDPRIAAEDADAIVVLTEWPQFRGLDWARLAGAVATPTPVDTRNLLDPAVVRRAGFSWVGIGRAA